MAYQLAGDQLDRLPFVIDHQLGERHDRFEIEARLELDAEQRFPRHLDVVAASRLLLRWDAGQLLFPDGSGETHDGAGDPVVGTGGGHNGAFDLAVISLPDFDRAEAQPVMNVRRDVTAFIFQLVIVQLSSPVIDDNRSDR
jgi:hypothetical protein